MTNRNSIKFSLLTQTWRVIKLSRLSYYIYQYKNQVKGQKKKQLVLVIIEEKKKYKVEKILKSLGGKIDIQYNEKGIQQKKIYRS